MVEFIISVILYFVISLSLCVFLLFLYENHVLTFIKKLKDKS